MRKGVMLNVRLKRADLAAHPSPKLYSLFTLSVGSAVTWANKQELYVGCYTGNFLSV
jgi:hypothetical protein